MRYCAGKQRCSHVWLYRALRPKDKHIEWNLEYCSSSSGTVTALLEKGMALQNNHQQCTESMLVVVERGKQRFFVDRLCIIRFISLSLVEQGFQWVTQRCYSGILWGLPGENDPLMIFAIGCQSNLSTIQMSNSSLMRVIVNHSRSTARSKVQSSWFALQY